MDPEMEIKLTEWIEDYLKVYLKMPSAKEVRAKASELTNFKQKFKASKGWYEKFMKRNYTKRKSQTKGENSENRHIGTPEEIFFDRESSERSHFTMDLCDLQWQGGQFSGQHSPRSISHWKI